MTTADQSSKSERTRILLVDDHPMMRVGLAAHLSEQPGFEICAEADNVNDAIARVKETNPDVAVIDIALKDGSGIDLIKDIASRFSSVRMLALSAYEESLYGERALRAGAQGYLNKQEVGEKIVIAIQTILQGERFISEEMTKRLIGQAINSGNASGAAPVESLTNRELEIFQLLGEGKTSSDIAARLHLSPHTVDTHRENIKRKFNVKTADELKLEAIRWVMGND